ncbi:hypothetical protein VNO78_10911 [Psophocarpus tetragonolobus]|uniref:Uncharacterized protein n=1 Tax=Psophocarpus tetragonolobus TaxID=3891 RepID=A0AAN9SM50_PSOTE
MFVLVQWRKDVHVIHKLDEDKWSCFEASGILKEDSGCSVAKYAITNKCVVDIHVENDVQRGSDRGGGVKDLLDDAKKFCRIHETVQTIATEEGGIQHSKVTSTHMGINNKKGPTNLKNSYFRHLLAFRIAGFQI